jgi:tetratricopeptide (TPR) repeat protein
LNLRSPRHPDRPHSLNNLANALHAQFEQLGNLQLLSEAVDLHRQALMMYPLDHPGRSNSLNNLANTLQTQFEQLGDLDCFAEAVDMHRQAVLLRPLRHLDHSNWLNSLASALMIQFEHIGGVALLAEAVDLLRQTLDLRLPRSSARHNSLSNLANALYVRFQELGDWESLMEAINLHAQALKLLPLGHPDRSSALSDLANALRSRGHLHGALNDNKAALNDVTAAISLHRQALELRPLGHPNRPKSLGNLAAALQAHFHQTGNLDSLAVCRADRTHLCRSMADADGPTVASTVYQKLLDEETFDLNNAPYALDDAVQLLREEKVDAERWAVFVHMGA